MGVLDAAEAKWEADHKEDSLAEAERKEAARLLYLTNQYNEVLEKPGCWQVDIDLTDDVAFLEFLEATCTDSEKARDAQVVLTAFAKLYEAYRARCKAIAEMHTEDAVFLGVL